MPSEEIARSLNYVDQLEAHMDEGGSIGPNNVRDLIDMVRHLASGYARGRAEAIEECAEIASQKSVYLPHHSDLDRGYAQGRADVATAIRTLSQKDTRHEG